MTKDELVAKLEKHIRSLKGERKRLLTNYRVGTLATHKANFFWKEIRNLEKILMEAKRDESKKEQ